MKIDPAGVKAEAHVQPLFSVHQEMRLANTETCEDLTEGDFAGDDLTIAQKVNSILSILRDSGIVKREAE